MIKSDKRRWLIIVAAFLVVTVVVGRGRDKNDWDVRALDRKADYIFNAASNADLGEDASSDYELLRYGLSLRPSDLWALREKAYYDFALQPDSSIIETSYRSIADYVTENPDDFYPAWNFANLAAGLERFDDAVATLSQLRRFYPNDPDVGMRLANILSSSNLQDADNRALAIYDSLEITEGLNAMIAYSRAAIHIGRSDTIKALDEGRHFLNVGGRYNTQPYIFMADLFAELGSPDSAGIYYNLACQIDSTDASAVFARIKYLNFIGDKVAYDNEMMHLLTMTSVTADAKIDVLKQYVSSIWLEDTVALTEADKQRINPILEATINSTPDDPGLRSLYAQYLILTNNIPEAIEQQQIAIDLDPSGLDGWLSLAGMLFDSKRRTEAIETLLHAVDFFPEEPFLPMMLSAYIFEGTNDQKEKQSALEYALRADSLGVMSTPALRSDILGNLGNIYNELDSVDAASEAYEQALRLKPGNALVLNNYAYMLACRNRELDKALQMISTAIELDPESATWLDTYAWVLFMRKDYEKALTQIEKALDMAAKDDDGISSELLSHAGDIYFMNRRLDEALEYWRRALQLEPNDELLKRKVKYRTYFIE